MRTTFPNTFPNAFYNGTSGASSDVPGRFDVAINGVGYILDSGVEEYQNLIRSIPFMRTQNDISSSVSEEALSRDSFWRKSLSSWHLGGNQTYWDLDQSDVSRFHTSWGINVWDKQQLTLLNDTTKSRTSANSDIHFALANQYLFFNDSTNITYTADMSSFNNLTGLPGTAATRLASDGYTVYSSHGASGIYSSTTAGAASSYNTGTVTDVYYVKGRLIVFNGASLYNPITNGALPAALMTLPTNVSWNCATEGPANIYLSTLGYDHSRIFKTAVVADGTALAIPTVAGELPTGELISCIYGYLGYMLIGVYKNSAASTVASAGFRLASIDTNGNLTLGPYVQTSTYDKVNDFTGQGQFVYFTHADGTYAGLGRIDLGQPNAGGTSVPAWAYDIYSTNAAKVKDVTFFNNKLTFSVDAVGIYTQNATYVASGTLDTGYITFKLIEDKTVSKVDVRSLPLPANTSITVSSAVNAGSFNQTGTYNTQGATAPSSSFSLLTRGELFEFRFTLATSDGTYSPTLRRATIKAFPAPERAVELTLPIKLFDTVTARDASEETFDVYTQFGVLDALMRSQQIVTIQLLGYSVQATITDYKFKPYKENYTQSWFDGTMVITARTIA